jgi:hypothetical protein
MTYHQGGSLQSKASDLGPDELADVVDRRLEEHRCDSDRDSEKRSEQERSQVPDRALVHQVTPLARRGGRPRGRQAESAQRNPRFPVEESGVFPVRAAGR